MPEETNSLSLGPVLKAAHAMQNVLLLLQAHTEMLQQQVDANTSTKNKPGAVMVKEVQSIYFNTRRLSKLLDSLLIYSQSESGEFSLKKEAIDICDLLISLVQEYRTAFPKILFILRVPASLFLTIDKQKVTIALRNILENAIKYGATKLFTQEIFVKVSVSESSYCLITISDRGPGIDNQDIAKVFLPFYRGKSGINNQGSGLGLAITQEIVRLHNGSVNLRTKPNGGLEVKVTLPL